MAEARDPQSSQEEASSEYRTITVPARVDHGGDPANRLTVTLRWVCPKCGGPRGEVFETSSWHGDKELTGVQGWQNPCGHTDFYDAIRHEAQTNQLNGLG